MDVHINIKIGILLPFSTYHILNPGDQLVTDWQVTATMIYCDAVDEDVTIMVYKDWSTKCTGYKKYVESPNKETAKMLKRKAKRLGRNLGC